MYQIEIHTFVSGSRQKTVLEFARHDAAWEAINSLRYAEAPCEIYLNEISNPHNPQRLVKINNS